MNCTQKLECIQEINLERTRPEQVGFLGICGKMHPINIGPNKIGRDPEQCDIVLDLQSVSRQHALINVLNQTEYMLMDFDSSNKTKLGIKTLPPYIPYPLKNGDTVQFGEAFGVFRLCNNDTDLPMTQDMDIPDTPIFTRHVTKILHPHSTTVPESPDVSDKDDSFIGFSQDPSERKVKSTDYFIRPATKKPVKTTILSEKIENSMFWKASRGSPSLNLLVDESDTSLSESVTSPKNDNKIKESNTIHEANTQIPNICSPEKIHGESIYTADTQLPSQNSLFPIHNMETQIPIEKDCLLSVIQKFNDQEQTEFEICLQNNENSNKSNTNEAMNIREATTQTFLHRSNNETNNININHEKDKVNNLSGISPSESSKHIEESDEEILFDEFESQVFICPDSQPLLADLKINRDKISYSTSNIEKQIVTNSITHETSENKISNNQSDNSTDCEDLDLKSTQKLSTTAINNDDSTDCEEDDNKKKEEPKSEISIDDMPTQILFGEDNTDFIVNKDKKTNAKDIDTQILFTEAGNKLTINNEIRSHNNGRHLQIDIEDMPTQVLIMKTDVQSTVYNNNEISNKYDRNNIEDIPTQILPSKPLNLLSDYVKDDIDNMATQMIPTDNELINNSDKDVENLTQIVDVEISKTKSDCDDPSDINIKSPSTIHVTQVTSPFKVPYNSALRAKKKENDTPHSSLFDDKLKNADNENYYLVVVTDSQKNISTIPKNNTPVESSKHYNDTQELISDLLTPQESASPNSRKLLSLSKHNTSSENSEENESVMKYVSSLSTRQINDLVGVHNIRGNKQKNQTCSDASDLDETPKKKGAKLIDLELLPDSQEIKTAVTHRRNSIVGKSSSGSDTENSQEQCTPILFRKKTRTKKDAKIDLLKRFDSEKLPTRVITRVRKPNKRYEMDSEVTKSAKNLLSSRYFTEVEENINTEIVNENISRIKKLKSKHIGIEKDDNLSFNLSTTDKRRLRKRVDPKHNNKEDNKNDLEIKKNKRKLPETKRNWDTVNESTSDDIKTKHIDVEDVKEIAPSRLSASNSCTTSKIMNQIPGEVINSSDENTSSKSSRQNSKHSRILRTSKDTNNADIKIHNKRGRKAKNDLTSDINDTKIEKAKTRSTKRNVNGKDTIGSHSQSKETKVNIKAINSAEESLPSHRRRKQAPDIEITSPVTKKSKYNTSSSSNTSTRSMTPRVSLRSTPSRGVRKQYVLFTAFDNHEITSLLEKLGAVIVSEVRECTVLATISFKRTFKLLCAVGLGKPIVGPNWVQACCDANMIVDPWLYLLKDEIAERKFKFNLEKTLRGQRNFLKGYSLSATPNVLPVASEMKVIVECSGGTWNQDCPNWLCISTPKDRSLWPELRKRGATIVVSELVLGGLLRQQLDIEKNKLS